MKIKEVMTQDVALADPGMTIADAARISIKAIRAGGLPTTEVPPSESHLRAPSGLFTRDREEAYDTA